MLIAELNRIRKIGCEFEMTCPLIGRGNGSDVQEVIAEVLGRNGITATVSYAHSFQLILAL